MSGPAAAWLLACLAFRAGALEEAKRPDAVIFLADDLGVADCGPYGGREVPTPHMDRLARSGMTFTRAFVSSPSCAPSRAALLTGLHPMRNGAMLNHARPGDSIRKWPAYFQEMGYEVAAIGKVAHYGQVTGYGFDHCGHFKYHEDSCVAEAVRWLGARKSGKPLCLLVGTNWPHVPWPREGTTPAAGVPPTQADTPETRQARGRYLAAVAAADRDLGLVLDAARRHLGEQTLFAFSSDHGSQFPFGKWNCYDAGVRVPLVVSWPGRVRAGTSTDAMAGWIDLLPTVLEACGGAPPANLDGRSFLPVLLGKSATHREKVFFTHSGDGKMNQYPIRAVRAGNWKYIRNLDPATEHHTHVDKGNANADGRAYWDSWVRAAKTDPRAAAVVRRYHTRPAEELYDTAADPWELANLAADPAHGARLRALRADLNGWMARQGDLGLPTEKALPDPRAKP